MNRARWIGASLFALALTAAPPSSAQDNKAAAEALFDAAKQLMEAKRYGEACPKLADSQRLDPGVGTLLNLALCYKQNGQSASAWSTYREAAAQAGRENQSEREELARKEAAGLEAVLTKLVIDVPPQVAATPGLEVKRDGTVVPQSLYGMPSPVDPGVRAIDVSAPNKKSLHLEARAEGPGSTARVVIPELERGAPTPVAAGEPLPTVGAKDAGAPPPSGPKEENPGKTQRIVGFVVGGAGVLTGAVGTWFGLLSIAQTKAADKASSESRKEKFTNDASSSRTVAFVGIGVGVAVLVGGIVIIVTAPSASSTASLGVSPELAQNGGGLRLTGTF